MDAAFGSYAEQCPDAIIATDAEGRVRYVNADRRMFQAKRAGGNRYLR